MHFGIKAGNPFFLAFQIAWLEEMLKKCQAMGITVIVQTGDMFDTRAMIKLNVLHFFLNQFPQLLQKYGIEAWITYGGNHDMYYRDSNEICSLDIIESLGKWDVNFCNVEFKVFKEEVGYVKINNKMLAFVPWLNKNNYGQLMGQLKPEYIDYVFGHFELVGMPMIPGVLCEHGIDPKEVQEGHQRTLPHCF